MFKYEISCAPFGKLSKQGEHTKNWTGLLSLPAFSGEFNVIIHGAKDGPLPLQVKAIERLLADDLPIKKRASAPMFDMHVKAGFAVNYIDDNAERIWELLKPEMVEVCDESYYRDGRICIVIVFGSRLEPDFAPAIETADGSFVGVLGGT
jgi:hypothetical protein